MSLMDLITKAAGSGAFDQIAQRVGLTPSEVQTTIGSLAPSVLPKIEQQATQPADASAATPGSSPFNAGPLAGAAANPSSLPQPGTPEAEDHGNSILGSIFGSKDVSRSVAQQTADDTGISVDKVKKVLPQLASIAAGALILRHLTHREGQAGGLGSIFGN